MQQDNRKCCYMYRVKHTVPQVDSMLTKGPQNCNKMKRVVQEDPNDPPVVQSLGPFLCNNYPTPIPPFPKAAPSQVMQKKVSKVDAQSPPKRALCVKLSVRMCAREPCTAMDRGHQYSDSDSVMQATRTRWHSFSNAGLIEPPPPFPPSKIRI